MRQKIMKRNLFRRTLPAIIIAVLMLGSMRGVLGSEPSSAANYGGTSDSEWRLMINGLVQHPLNLSLSEIAAMPKRTEYAELWCNFEGLSEGTMLVGKGNWTGVRLGLLLEKAGIDERAGTIEFYAKDKYTITLRISKAMQDSVIVAYELNGNPLNETLRLVLPNENGNLWISMITSITVVPLGTNIALTHQPSSPKRDASTNITAKLTDDNNVPLRNQTIDFMIGTTSLGFVNTDSSGYAVKAYLVTVDAGTYVIKASYNGSTDYGSSKASSTVVVRPQNTTQIINAPSAKTGETATITSTLKDENGNPVTDANIIFYLFENNIWLTIGTATTNSVGEAYTSQTFNTTGSYEIKAAYTGSTNYALATNATATLTISPSSGIAFLNMSSGYALYYSFMGVIVLALIVAIGYMLFRRRKKTRWFVPKLD
jgi:DMSO/TMAO reductase YedYZ molybdopterin-dependent catalytic subunit